MMRSRALSGFFLAMSSALLLQPLFVIRETQTLPLAILLALAALLLFPAEDDVAPGRWRPLLTAIGAGGLCFVFTPQWWPALLLVVAGSLLELPAWSWPRRTGQALRWSGLGLLLGMMAISVSSVIQAMFSSDVIVARTAEGLATLFGMDAGLVAGNLAVQTPEEVLHFSTAPEWTGFHLRMLALLMLTGALLLRGGSPLARLRLLLQRLPLFLVLTTLWQALCFLILARLSAMYLNYELAWMPLLQILLGVPSGLVAAFLAVQGHSAADPDAVSPPATPDTWLPGRAAFRPWLLSFAAWILLIAGLLFQDPGHMKPGRVLIDDGHSDWEWAGEPMNTWQFGTKTTYNYHGLGKLLERYYQTGITKAEITPALLDSVDVLILKTPTRPYSESEQECILRWVKEGGGLYVISDHTDIFGMSTFLNELTAEFGFTYNKDTVFDLKSTKDQFWPGYDVLPHPAAIHVPFYRYLTGCSIRPGWGCEVVMSGPMTGSDLLSYSTSNFFDTWYPRTEMRFGNLVQLVSARYGRGRVVGFSDSTTYSNFAMFLPGRLEHLISIVEYLNRRNSLLPWRLLLLLGGLICAWAATRSGSGSRDQASAALLALLLMLPLRVTIDRSSHSWPETIKRLPTSSLDTLYSQVHLPILNKLEADDPLDMESFYIWQYRSGRIPELATGSPGPDSEVFTVINPGVIPKAQDQQRMDDFMRAGGTMLVAGSPGNLVNGINAWLGRYNVGYVKDSWRDTTVVHTGHSIPVFVHAAQGVHGGRPGYRIQFGDPVSTEVKVGKGRLILSGLADCFSNPRLGRYDSVPSGLSYEYLQMYYRHTDIETGRSVEALQGRAAD